VAKTSKASLDYHKARAQALAAYNKEHGTKHKSLKDAGISLAKPKPEAVAQETNLPVEIVAQATQAKPKRTRTRRTTAKRVTATPKRTRKSKVAEPTADLVLEDGVHADDPEEREAMERGIKASEEAVESED
jgi:hypothetical protein